MPRRDPKQPKVPTERPSREAAARDPRPGATNRPGFDLGGAVGEEKPRKSATAGAKPGARAPGKRSRPRVARVLGRVAARQR